jgi:hypothetical protein
MSPNIRLSVMLMESLSEFLPSRLLNNNNPSSTQATTNDIFHTQICRIVLTDGQCIKKISSTYFRGIHRWLPIIAQKRFEDRLMTFNKDPAADFSLLLLCIVLITQHPNKDLSNGHDRDVIYLATKTLFTQIRSFIPNSLYLIQAGIILASHEHAHGMIEAAYDTIGITARMAFAMDMHKKSTSIEIQGTDAWVLNEEALATWWGLVICDRFVLLGY